MGWFGGLLLQGHARAPLPGALTLFVDMQDTGCTQEVAITSMKACLVMQVVMHNISQEDVEQGQVQYIMHVKEMEKNRYARLCAVFM